MRVAWLQSRTRFKKNNKWNTNEFTINLISSEILCLIQVISSNWKKFTVNIFHWGRWDFQNDEVFRTPGYWPLSSPPGENRDPFIFINFLLLIIKATSERRLCYGRNSAFKAQQALEGWAVNHPQLLDIFKTLREEGGSRGKCCVQS